MFPPVWRRIRLIRRFAAPSPQAGEARLAMLTASAPLPLAGEGGRRPGEGSLLRYGALGRFGQARLVAVRGVALDEALLGRLVDLGETGRHGVRLGDRAARLFERRAEARLAGA